MHSKVTLEEQEIQHLTHISKIQQHHLKHQDLQFIVQQNLTIYALRYNTAMLAKAANQLIFYTTYIADYSTTSSEWETVNSIATGPNNKQKGSNIYKRRQKQEA
jgi:hypothetical protein